MANYKFSTQSASATPQSKAIPGRDMKQNLAGGYAFKADDWDVLRRWLMTGSMSNAFYQGKEQMTEDNLKILAGLVNKDPEKVASEILNASKKGISVHTPILALTFLSMGEMGAKTAFKNNFNSTIRTASQLYEFMTYCKDHRGMGSLIHKAVGKWMSDKDIKDLEYQFLKYQSRDGFAGRDVLRLIKPHADGDRAALYNWVSGGSKKNPLIDPDKLPDTLEKIKVFEKLKKGVSEDDAADAIRKFGLTHEMIPANIKRTKAIWSALFEKMPVGATVRNLGNLTEKGIFADIKYLDMLEARLSRDGLQKGYIHPIQLAVASKVYGAGGELGKSALRWSTVPRVEDILSDAIQLSFDVLTPSGKSFFYALDVSGSMTGGNVGTMWMTPMEIEGVMALASVKSEKNYFVGGFDTTFTPMNIRKSTTYKDVMNMRNHQIWPSNFGGTDASQAYKYAIANKIFTDVFVMYTDNCSWAGDTHASQALTQYRKQINPNAKAIYVTMVPYGDNVTLADPNDKNSYDIASFSAETPKLISMIASGDI